MTPKEKAKDLLSKMDVKHQMKLGKGTLPISMYKSQIKQCALIAVDEILDSLKYPPKPNEHRQVVHIKTLKYWHEVKQEIKLL